MGLDSMNEEETDQEYFVELGKPPHHVYIYLLFIQACFVFKNKTMHVLILL